MPDRYLAPNASTYIDPNAFSPGAGYDFAGWAVSASGPVAYANTAPITVAAADIDFYACWHSSAFKNEMGGAEEADYAILQTPTSIIRAAGASSGAVYGRVFETGLTEAPGAHANIRARLGCGLEGVDPRDARWNWTNASFSIQVGNNDEYQASFAAPAAPGSYRYTFSFSLDGGSTWTLADSDGTGSNAGLDYSAEKLGMLTVN
jgi:uncharacterized repeat protein (TIGR02543 family)